MERKKSSHFGTTSGNFKEKEGVWWGGTKSRSGQDSANERSLRSDVRKSICKRSRRLNKEGDLGIYQGRGWWGWGWGGGWGA